MIQKKNHRFLLAVVFLSMLLSSCKKERSCEGCKTDNNKPPIAIAGPDQTIILPVNNVSLNGSSSSDPDGTISNFQWTKISGPVSVLRTPNLSQTIADSLLSGVYLFELIVTDDKGLTDKDTVQVFVNDPFQPIRSPVANAGIDQQIILPANSVNLNGNNSTDPDNNIISYLWTKISGPASFNIVNANVVQTQLNNLTEGVYQFELKVTDAVGLFDTDTVLVTVIQPSPPPPPPPASCVGMCPLSSSCAGYWVCIAIPEAQSIKYSCLNDFSQAYSASASLQSKVYFAGGHDDFSVYGGSLNGGVEYDAANNSNRCFTLSIPRSFLAGATAGNKILFAGGTEVSGYGNNPVYNTVDIYDGQSLANSIATLSEARSHLASVSTGTKAYFIGGRTQNGFSEKMDVYDATGNSWQVINLPRERGYAGAAVIGSNIYIAGGKNNTGNIRTIDIYNVQSGQWSSIEAPHDHPIASVAAINNKLIVAGGDGLNNKSADIYDITTGQWSSVSLSDSRFNMTVASANNKIIFLGGALSISGITPSNESSAIDIYDDNTGNWSVGTISPGVSGVMAASVGTQIIYVGFMSANSTINYAMAIIKF